MALLVDRFHPQSADQLDFNKEQTINLERMIVEGDFPHLLFYGPPGSGKKTRVMLLLRAAFGPSVEKVLISYYFSFYNTLLLKHHLLFPRQIVVESRTLKKGTSTATFEITLLTSPHHIEVSPSDAGNSDRFVVMELIKEIAEFRPMDLSEGASARNLMGMSEPTSSSSSSSSSTKPAQQGQTKGLFKGLFRFFLFVSIISYFITYILLSNLL